MSKSKAEKLYQWGMDASDLNQTYIDIALDKMDGWEKSDLEELRELIIEKEPQSAEEAGALGILLFLVEDELEEVVVVGFKCPNCGERRDGVDLAIISGLHFDSMLGSDVEFHANIENGKLRVWVSEEVQSYLEREFDYQEIMAEAQDCFRTEKSDCMQCDAECEAIVETKTKRKPSGKEAQRQEAIEILDSLIDGENDQLGKLLKTVRKALK